MTQFGINARKTLPMSNHPLTNSVLHTQIQSHTRRHTRFINTFACRVLIILPALMFLFSLISSLQTRQRPLFLPCSFPSHFPSSAQCLLSALYPRGASFLLLPSTSSYSLPFCQLPLFVLILFLSLLFLLFLVL